MGIKEQKDSNFTKDLMANNAKAASSASQLSASIDIALKQQAYMHLDPDDNGAGDYIDVISSSVDEIAAVLGGIAEKAGDLIAVKSGVMTVDQLIAKYPAIDVAVYSAELSPL